MRIRMNIPDFMLYNFQANESLMKLAPEVVEEIFERCLLDGSRRLYFEEFEKAVIMASMLLFPGSHAACAYTSMVDKAIIYLPSLRSSHFPDSNLDRLAGIADAVLEKSSSCNFRPPSMYCSVCTWPETLNTRSPPARPKGSVRRHTPPPALASSPLRTSEVSIKAQADNQLTRIEDSIAAEHGSLARKSPKRRSRPTKAPENVADEIDLTPAVPRTKDVHEIACKFDDTLVGHFGSRHIAFQFLDAATGNETGQVSATKFRYCFRALGLDGDMRGVFAYFDVDADGAISEQDFNSWKEVREKQKAQNIAVSLPHSSS